MANSNKKNTLVLLRELLDTDHPRLLMGHVDLPVLIKLAEELGHEFKTPPTEKQPVMEAIIDVLDHINIRGAAELTPRNFVGFSDAASNGSESMAGQVRHPGVDKMVLGANPDVQAGYLLKPNQQHLLTPKEQCQRMKIPPKKPTNIAAVTQILANLHGRGQLDDKLEVLSGGKSVPVKTTVVYGSKGRHPTFYSDTSLTPYLIEQLQLIPLKPETTTLVSTHALLHDHVRVNDTTEHFDKTEALLASLLESKYRIIRMDDGTQRKVQEVVKVYRTPGHDKVFYCDPGLTGFVTRSLGLEPRKKEGDGTKDFVTIEKLLENHIRVNPSKELKAEVKELLDHILKRPDTTIDIGGGDVRRVASVVRVLRTAKNPRTLYSDPAIAPYVMRELGIAPILPEDHAHLLFPTDYVKTIGYNGGRGDKRNTAVDDLEAFLEHELAAHPNLVINEETGRTVKDSVQVYRMRREGERVYVHKDMDAYLRREWLDKLPPVGDERWLTGEKLCNAFPVPWTSDNNKAIEEVLKDMRAKRKHETVTLANDDKKPLGSVIRRFTKFGDAPRYYLESEGVNVVVTGPMILAQAKKIKDRPVEIRLPAKTYVDEEAARKDTPPEVGM